MLPASDFGFNQKRCLQDYVILILMVKEFLKANINEKIIRR